MLLGGRAQLPCAFLLVSYTLAEKKRQQQRETERERQREADIWSACVYGSPQHLVCTRTAVVSPHVRRRCSSTARRILLDSVMPNCGPHPTTRPTQRPNSSTRITAFSGQSITNYTHIDLIRAVVYLVWW